MLLCHMHWLCAFYMFTSSYQNWTRDTKNMVSLKNTCLTREAHVQGMWDPHQSISWPQKPLLRVQDHQNWSRNTRAMGGPLNGPCLQNFMILDAFRYRVKRLWLHQNQIIELNLYFWSTIFKYTSFYLVILLIKIQGVLLLRMDLWRTEEASTRPLICILCLK